LETGARKAAPDASAGGSLISGSAKAHGTGAFRPLGAKSPELPTAWLGIGVARTGEREKLAVGRGRHVQNLGVVVPAGELGQHDALARGVRARKQEIGAERGLELMHLGQIVDCVRARNHPERAEPALARERARVLLAQERLRAEPDALFGHEPRRRLVHQMPVLDAPDAGRHGPLDRNWRVGVNGP
jgi:hypothetical protein